MQLHRGGATRPTAPTAGASASPRPSRPARRCRARARARGRASPRCPRCSERRRRRRAARRARAARGPPAVLVSFSLLVGMWSSERKGQITSGTRSSTGGSRRSPTRRSTSCADAVLLGEGAGDRRASLPTGRRRSPARPACAIGTAMRPEPTASSTTGPSQPQRLVDVERDVLDDRGAPRVVDPGDRVVERHDGQSRTALRRRVPAEPLVRSTPHGRRRARARGLAAAAAASSTDEIEAVRVEYLGRKSAIKQALREVRDRETGMALNAVRERLEAAIDAREAELARAELDARLTTERADVTLPVGGYARGRLHLITQIRREVEDVFLGLGYTVVDGREVETTRYNFDALNFPPGHPARSPLATLFLDDETVLRTETSPSQIRAMEAQQPPDLHRHARPRLPARHARRDALADLPPGRGARGRRGHHARRPEGNARLPAQEALRRAAPDRVPHALLPVHRAVDRGVRLVPRLRRRRLPGLPPLRLDRGRRRRAWSIPKLFEFVGYDPERYTRLRLRLGPRAHRDAPPRVPRPARALAQRPPLLEAVLMRAPLSWLREYVNVDATAHEIARRLAVSSLEVDRVIDVGVADTGDNLSYLRVGKVVAADKHPNADKLQLCQVDVGEGEPRQIVCGAWNFGVGATVAVGPPGRAPAGLPRPARRAAAPGRALARDDPRRGRDRPRLRPRRDHGAPRRDRAGHAARRRAAGARAGARRDADDEPRRPALDGRARPRGRDALRRRADSRSTSSTRRSCIRTGSRSTVETPRAARATSAACSRTSPSGRRRCGFAPGSTPPGCARSRTSST